MAQSKVAEQIWQQQCVAKAVVEQHELQKQTTTTIVVDKPCAIEATIIDIPLPAAPPLSCPTFASSAASSSSSYDTDSSTASSTCCTRHGEHIYMEKAQNKQQQAQQQHSADPEAGHLKSELRQHWPLFMLMISIIEIAIFIYDSATVSNSLVAGGGKNLAQDIIPNMPIPTDSVFIYRPDRRLQVWRFISYMFLHANWFHLGFNVVVQLFYGIPLEVMHGSARVAIIYFAGVFAGSLGTSVVDSEVYLLGASGGVYALLAAHLANITLNYSQMRYAVAQLLSVVIFVSCDLGYALYTQYLDTESVSSVTVDLTLPNTDPPQVSYIAHLTGALAGFTIGLLVLKNFEHRAYENIIWWLALGIYSAFTVFAIVFNLINTITGQLVEERSEVVAQQLLYDLGVS